MKTNTSCSLHPYRGIWSRRSKWPFFLSSILLSGLMFPFRGMPVYAQRIGEILPLTHYLRIVRGIVLKGNSIEQILPNLWPITMFLVVSLAIDLKRYRSTLD